MKKKGVKVKTTHPWAEILTNSSFDLKSLEILHEHYSTMSSFYTDPDPITTKNGESTNEISPLSRSETSSFENLSFEKYCYSLHTLIKYGTPMQHFEYLFCHYAVESDKGISRAEIFQMLQDHFYAAPHEKTDPRHFEKIYTWLKKNFPIFDLTKIGYLGWSITYDLITAFPLALMHFKLQQAVLVNKIAENNVRYKAAKEASKFK